MPNLRFPEFSGEWEKYKVSDLLDFYSTNSLAWEQLEYKPCGLANLHYGLIHNGLPTCIDVGEADLPTIKDTCLPKKYTLCKDGDVAFADASEDTNDAAKCVEFTNCNGRDVVCGLHTIHGRDNSDKTVVGFKGYAFSAQVFRHQIRRLAQGTKIYSINSKNFSECYIGLPYKEEQAKIANLLHLLDQRIETQKKIIEDLKKLKESLCKLLLSKIEGKEYALGSIARLYQPQTIQTTSLSQSGIYSVYGANGIIGKYHAFNHREEQICIACRGSNCGVVNYTEPYCWITGNSMVVNTDGVKIVDKRYLYHYLSSLDFRPLISGSGQPQIVRTPLSKLAIVLPNINNQKQLASVLDSCSKKVNIEQSVHNLLLRQKCSLLSQLFI